MAWVMRRAEKMIVLVLLLAIGSGIAAAEQSTGGFSATIDTFFAQIKADFDKIAQSQSLKRSARAPIDQLFWQNLKAHQPYYSLIRTNAKGIVVNEKVRLENPQPNPKAEKKSMAGEAWFKSVSTKRQGYAGHMKDEDQGRYYLIWASPIMAADAKGKESFSGAVMVKVDLWDCFRAFGKKQNSPFLIRMEQISLYSDKWEKGMAYAEEKLNVPGVQRISVRFPAVSSNVAADDSLARQAAMAEAARVAAQDSIKAALAAKAVAQKKAANQRIAIIVGAVVFVIFLVFLVQLVRVLRQKAMIRKIEQGTL